MPQTAKKTKTAKPVYKSQSKITEYIMKTVEQNSECWHKEYDQNGELVFLSRAITFSEPKNRKYVCLVFKHRNKWQWMTRMHTGGIRTIEAGTVDSSAFAMLESQCAIIAHAEAWMLLNLP